MSDTGATFNAAYLQRFTKVLPDCERRRAEAIGVQLHMNAKPGRPVKVTVGENYRAIIMPIRNRD